jgi:hypothetical protein
LAAEGGVTVVPHAIRVDAFDTCGDAGSAVRVVPRASSIFEARHPNFCGRPPVDR